MPVCDPDRLIDARVEAIRRYHETTGIPRAELDLSGGIDSATMAGLLQMALGPDQITMVYSSINSGAPASAGPLESRGVGYRESHARMQAQLQWRSGWRARMLSY